MSADHRRERVCVQSLPECMLLMHECIQHLLSTYCVLERSAGPFINWYLSTCTMSSPKHFTQMIEHLLCTDPLLDMDQLSLVLPAGAHPGGLLLFLLESPARVYPSSPSTDCREGSELHLEPWALLKAAQGRFSDSEGERINGLKTGERFPGA